MVNFKMDDNPGMSIFQHSHFEVIKSNAPAPEEIEAEQDQKRYQKELEQILEDEFEDLADVNSSINSSYSLPMNGYHTPVEKKSHRLNGHVPSLSNGSDNHRFKSKDFSSLEQLEVLYQVRLREIEKLRDEKENLQKLHRQEKDNLTAINQQLRTEKDNIIVSHKEVQKMLVERNERLAEAERELTGYRDKWSESEKIKSDALHQLEMNKITIKELEKRLIAAEKNSYVNEEKNFDNLLKELTSKNKREISDLQKEIRNLNHKIVTKDIDYAKLEQKLVDTQRSHETVLSEKAKLIEKLNANLAECHSRYQSLLMEKKNSDVSHLLHEIQQKTLEIDEFKSEIIQLKEQIVRFENIAKNGYSRDNGSDQMRKRNLSPASYSELVKLKKVLQNAMDNFKSKQTETETLREKSFTLSKEVETLRRSEIECSTEIEALKAERENLLSELTKNQKEKEMLKINFMDYVTKTDILHQEQISELELVSSKKLLELEAKMKELEVRFKDDAMKAFTEEVNQITSIYSDHFNKLNVTVEQLKTDQDERNSQIQQLTAKIEKYREEAEKIYNKYRNARKIAITLRQITEDRTQLLRRHHKQFVQTLNEIQKYLDNALVSKTIETDKLTELIEKSAKNTKNVDELLGNAEMNAMLLDINKRLMSSGSSG